MKLLVYMRDGRTVYYLTGRSNLRQLMNPDPANEGQSVLAVRGIWNPTTGEYVWTRGIRLRFIAKGSIGSVEEGSPENVEIPT